VLLPGAHEIRATTTSQDFGLAMMHRHIIVSLEPLEYFNQGNSPSCWPLPSNVAPRVKVSPNGTYPAAGLQHRRF
jgi:hypothetical protein